MFIRFPAVPVLAYPFRIFFLLTGGYAALAIIGWITHLFGALPLPLGWSSLHWHSHEMLFGFVAAAIAGFLLTAMCNWTGAPPLRDARLLLLVILWLAGRVVMWTASHLPPWFTAVVDLAFVACLTGYVALVLVRHRNHRNLKLVAILALLLSANLLMHLGFTSGKVQWLQWGQSLAIDVIVLMMLVIGGRIIPLFTANWLRLRGHTEAVVHRYPVVEFAALAAVVVLIPLQLLSATPVLIGVVSFIASAANLVRLLGWDGWRCMREPLLWSLHLGYAWIVIALALRGAAALALVAESAWLHAIGSGAMATLILAVMTRVALGHTGRPLQLPKFAVLAYLTLTFAAVFRVLTALQVMDYRFGLGAASIAWTIAFAIFLSFYWPILTSPRVDGRAG